MRITELTGAIATIASGGLRTEVHSITEIRDSAGAVLYRYQPDDAGEVIGATTNAKMQDVMSEVVRTGTGKAAALDRPAAGKTGTSQDYRDAWFIGFTGNLVGGVWLGNDDNAPMKHATGGGLPAHIFKQFMESAEAGLPAKPLAGQAPAVASEAPQEPEQKNGLEQLLDKLFNGT